MQTSIFTPAFKKEVRLVLNRIETFVNRFLLEAIKYNRKKGFQDYDFDFERYEDLKVYYKILITTTESAASDLKIFFIL